MRNTNYTQALTSVRKISARATFTDKLMRFAVLQASESITIASTDSDLYGSDLLRVAVEATTGKIHFAQHSQNDANFAATLWTDTGRVCRAGSGIGLHGARLFYQAVDGTIYFSDKGATTFGADTSTSINYAQPVSIAPVSSTEFYVVTLDGDGVNDYMMRRVFYHSTAGASAEYHGRLYGDNSVLNIVDAVRFGGMDYIYFLDNSEKRTVYIKKSGDWWSEVQQVVPMDVVDDMTSFVMSSATVINEIVLVTGVLRRTYGDPLHVYSVGPEEFTAGKELVIRPEDTDKVGGKLHLFDGKTWYVGAGFRFYAEQTAYLGVDNPALKTAKTDVLGFSLTCAQNSAYSLNLDMFHDFTHTALRPGSQVKLEVTVNDEYSDLGTFNLDGFSRPIEGSGASLGINLRSDGYKRLSQWVSDTSYDYWSQTKLDTDPSELSEVIRVNGDWNAGEEGFYLDDFNTACYLYVTSKACRNGIMRGKFIKHSGDFGIRFGVGLNYYLESKYDASVRLGVEMDEVAEEQYGRNGIFAIYGDYEHEGGEGIGLYLLENSVLEQITSASYAVTEDASHWLMIRFNEGKIDIEARAETSTTWTPVISIVFSSYETMPWKVDDMGRGAILCENVTPHSPSYAFRSDDNYIPVMANTGFPASGSVIVDSERMSYTGKSNTGYGLLGPFNFAYGYDWHKNTSVGAIVRAFGRYKTANRYVQTIEPAPSQYLNAISLWVAKAGNPKEGLKVSVYKSPRGTGTVFGTLVAESTIPADEIAGNGDTMVWVTAKFHGEVLWSTSTYYIVLERDDISTVLGDTLDQNYEYRNYYGVQIAGDNTYPYDSEMFDETTQNFVGTGAITYKTVGFKLWGNIRPYNDGNVVHCAIGSLLPNKADTEIYSDLNDMALVVTDGTGAGNTYKIVGYSEYNNVAAILLDRNAQDTLDETSVFYIAPTLTGATRGTNDTSAVAHSAGACHIYRDRPFCSLQRVQYYSSERDNSLEDMVRAITRKAGVLELSGVNLFPGQIIPSTNNLVLAQKNFRIEFDFSSPFTSGTIVISGRRETSGGDGANLQVSETSLSYYSGPTLNEVFALDQPLAGKVMVTYYENHLSVWCSGRHVYTFTMKEGEVDGSYFTVTGSHASPVNIYVPEASIRIDNYILDAGQNGESLVSGVIGEKRFYLADDIDGGMKLFRARATVNSNAVPYQLTISGGEVQSDTSLATRMRLEGSDICEKYDAEMMVEYGNLFYMANMREINSPADAEWFAAVLLDDIGSRVISKAYYGAADPRVEPNDLIWVETKDGRDRIIVDYASFVYATGANSLAFDMSINGRIAREDLLS